MENVDKLSKVSDIVEKTVDNSFLMRIKKSHGINETNLMTLPFISLKRKKVSSFERIWARSNNEIVSMRVVGGEDGVPQIGELDVLLALFRIHLKNNKHGFLKEKDTNKVQIPQKINFTFTQLAKEMGYKEMSGALKRNLDKSIRKLNETTIYNNFAIMDITEGQYCYGFKNRKSCRILKNYNSYEMSAYKKMNGKLANPYEVKDLQYVEIDDFFLNNMCNNYYKIYDYEKYKELKMSVSKKIFLILNTWSKVNSKYLTYQTLADYIGLDYKEKKDQYYAVKQINNSMKELVDIGYIDDFEVIRNKGINLIFNQKRLDAENYKKYFLTENEMIGELRQIGVDYEDIIRVFRENDNEYIAAMLRMMRIKVDKGERIKNKKEYFLSAVNGEKFNLKQYMNN